MARILGADEHELTTAENTIEAEPSTANLLELNQTDRLLLKYLVTYPEMKSSKLAKILGMNEGYIRNRVKRPVFKFAMQKLMGTTDQLMSEAAKKAAYRLLELIDHPDPDIALRAIRIALTKYLNQISDVTMDRILIYKSTIAPDGNLLQTIVKGEIETIDIGVSSGVKSDD